ncbi:MAG TPA: hypothetical protein VMN99_10680 [Anaerolineales bacterium]|nr:hypothetical protein [Anaerolineales bacterium]
MLDAYGPDYPQYLPGQKKAGYKISVHLNTLRLHGIADQVRYLLRRVQRRINVILSSRLAVLLVRLKLPLPRKVRYEYIAKLIDHAAEMYPRERVYPGTVTVFRALTQPAGIQADSTLGWAKLVSGSLNIHDVVGTHHSIMMHEPHVAELVRMMGDHLGKLHSQVSPGT